MTDAKTQIAAFVDRVLTNEAWAETGAEVATEVMRILTEAGWRAPLPKTDVATLVAVVGGMIDEHFGDDHVENSRAAAKAILDRGYLDKAGEIGPPEPVVSTLRRVIRDLEGEALRLDGHSRDIGGGFTEQRIDHIIGAQTLRDYAARLRSHPVLPAESAPSAQDETEWKDGSSFDVEPSIGGLATVDVSGWPADQLHVWLRVDSYAHKNEGADVVLQPDEARELAVALDRAARHVSSVESDKEADRG